MASHEPCTTHACWLPSSSLQVEFPDGRTTLCLLPAKFHKKLWIKRGNFLIIENIEDADTAVTGQILHVLFADDVKRLKKLDGVWPPEFTEGGAAAADDLASTLEGLSIEGEATQSGSEGENEAKDANSGEVGSVEKGSESESSSDDDLPPISKIQNRRVIEYDISDTDSE